jgi:hypothetical protein
MSAKRQISLAGFLVPAGQGKRAKREEKVAPIAPISNDKINLDRAVVSQPSATDQKLASRAENNPTSEGQDFEIVNLVDSPGDDAFTAYPPVDHPSYHLPPSPDFNHPIAITTPPPALLSALQFNTIPKPITSPADLDLLFFHHFIAPAAARKVTKYLLDEMPWYRVNYTTRTGQDIKTPRYTTVFGKDSTALPWTQYPQWKPRAIPEILLRLMQRGEHIGHVSPRTHR